MQEICARGIKDPVLNESFAYANAIKRMLQAARDGQFSKEEVTETIEYFLKCAKAECRDTALFSALSRMGLKGISDDMKTPYHYLALEAIKKHNPDLKFRDRRLNDLIAESDKTIDDIIATWKKTRLKDQLPAIIASGFVITLFLILTVLIFLH